MKWFKRWRVKDLLQLSVIEKYVIVEHRSANIRPNTRWKCDNVSNHIALPPWPLASESRKTSSNSLTQVSCWGSVIGFITQIWRYARHAMKTYNNFPFSSINFVVLILKHIITNRTQLKSKFIAYIPTINTKIFKALHYLYWFSLECNRIVSWFCFLYCHRFLYFYVNKKKLKNIYSSLVEFLHTCRNV